MIGIFLPLMPTTVFPLLAAACYARSWDRIDKKLIRTEPGSYIRNSREAAACAARQDAHVTQLGLASARR